MTAEKTIAKLSQYGVNSFSWCLNIWVVLTPCLLVHSSHTHSFHSSNDGGLDWLMIYGTFCDNITVA